MKKDRLCLLLLIVMAFSCQSKTAEVPDEEMQEAITPVTITTIATEPMTDFIELNATSTFLQKAYVKASSNGYLTSVNTQVGKMVSGAQTLFVLKTKEAQSIGNTINLLDSSFNFSGVINIKAGTSGYISEMNHQSGDFVQEGEPLATISDINSFVFILNLPYELRPFILNQKKVALLLPDGKSLPAIISSFMPVVDSVSQTQNIILKVNDKNIPSNLIAKVRVIKTAKTNTISLPKQSILSDETQTNFWVMKVMDDSTSVKVPVTKGLEVNGRIEILSPPFSPTDKFLLTGNYGLEDTAKIKIIQQ